MKRILKQTFFFLIFLSGFLIWGNAEAATYYSDFSTGADSNSGTSIGAPWKYAPGMSGWSGSATLSSGDVVVLKGGETWTFTSTTANLWTIPVSGITIQGGQRLETPWGTDYPVLDGAGATVNRKGINFSGRSNITIDGIKIQNTVIAETDSGDGIYAVATSVAMSNIEIKNCYLSKTGDHGISIQYGTNSTGSNIRIHRNTFLNSCQGVTSYIDSTAVVSGYYVYNNDFQGPGNSVSGLHCDGIMLGSACADANTCLDTIEIYNNKFSGDWVRDATGLINLQNGTAPQPTNDYYGGKQVKIYNNQLAADTDGMMPGLIAIYSKWDDVKIYNNTFGGYNAGVDPRLTGIMINDNATNIDIKNNIFSGLNPDNNQAISGKSGTYTSDYNFFSTDILRLNIQGSPDCRTSASCLSQFGTEEHSAEGDPKFATSPNGTVGVGDWTIQSDSPAINIGTDLSEYFTTDILGATRSGAWDIGAYEYVGVSDIVAPASPSGLAVS
ncbi:MAG TPA: right-handed parallel beta-helix repeat-containing protein [Candidatus Moranbacteria bacterium]|nr:right-handed parallel beta-helix repeat-containing protein [Candidatus Moranbacteria bacterium]HSA07965.1 right-handed parallel beta-helix repeat-containing protein [Candidatus Moranbacteria bacterium]